MSGVKTNFPNGVRVGPSELTANPTQEAIGDLDQVVSDPPTDEEVQAISDKVDEVLSALRGAGIIKT